jgi:excisionase family DNA binding protein
MTAPTLTIAELLERGDVCTVEQCAEILGISRGSAYAGCKRGDIPAIRVGVRYIVPLRRLAALLGADVDGNGSEPT